MGAAPYFWTHKRFRLGSDGASNMFGAKAGVAACIESIRHIAMVRLFS